MKALILILAIAFFIVPLQTAHGQNNGLSYSATNGKSYSKHKSKMRYSKQAVPAIPNAAKANTAATAITTEEQKSAEEKIWNKYKALAGGLENTPKANTIPVKKVKKIKAPQENSKQNKPPTGLAGIISQYQASKKQRSQMRSLTITKPQNTETETQN